uniref:(northern house mosquito) hypothetical protein n=1 Tax=Culex pipiens TaxID=7175 RepID=A0A8D8HL75_CULPI
MVDYDYEGVHQEEVVLASGFPGQQIKQNIPSLEKVQLPEVRYEGFERFDRVFVGNVQLEDMQKNIAVLGLVVFRPAKGAHVEIDRVSSHLIVRVEHKLAQFVGDVLVEHGSTLELVLDEQNDFHRLLLVRFVIEQPLHEEGLGRFDEKCGHCSDYLLGLSFRIEQALEAVDDQRVRSGVTTLQQLQEHLHPIAILNVESWIGDQQPTVQIGDRRQRDRESVHNLNVTDELLAALVQVSFAPFDFIDQIIVVQVRFLQLLLNVLPDSGNVDQQESTQTSAHHVTLVIISLAKRHHHHNHPVQPEIVLEQFL